LDRVVSNEGAVKTVDRNAVDELTRVPGISPATAAKIHALGIKRPLEAHYPAETWAACVQLLASELFPSDSDGQKRLGAARIDVFASSLRGKVTFWLARRVPREKSIERFVHGLQGGASYIETRFTRRSQTEFEAWLSDTSGVPGFFAGMLQQGIRLATGASYSVAVEDPLTFCISL
jgi:uncharacterized protein (TIGR02265 family)